MKLVYICRALFKNGGGGGLKERPLTENAGHGCFQRGLSREKQGIWELKITKKRIFFLKRRSFRSAQVGKSRTKNCIFLTAHVP